MLVYSYYNERPSANYQNMYNVWSQMQILSQYRFCRSFLPTNYRTISYSVLRIQLYKIVFILPTRRTISTHSLLNRQNSYTHSSQLVLVSHKHRTLLNIHRSCVVLDSKENTTIIKSLSSFN